MTSNSIPFSTKLCLLLLTWAYRDVDGRPPSPHFEQSVSGYWTPNGSVTINTGPAAAGGTVNIVVYPSVGKWAYSRTEPVVDIEGVVLNHLSTTAPKPTTHVTENHHVKTTRPPISTTPKPTTHVTGNHPVKTTRPPISTTVGVDPFNIIVAPPIPRECPDGERPDMSNNCREEWPDFSRRLPGKAELTTRSTSTSTSTPTARTSSVVHHTRKHRP